MVHIARERSLPVDNSTKIRLVRNVRGSGLGCWTHGEVFRRHRRVPEHAVGVRCATVRYAGGRGGARHPAGRQCGSSEGPAPAWIVADMDTGAVLAEREMNVPHPPASTIKTLLVLTVLDEVTNLDATVVGTEEDTHVECSLRRRRAGPHLHRASASRSGAADVGQRRGQRAGRHDRRLRHRGGQDERQGRGDRCVGHPRDHTVRAGRTRRLTAPRPRGISPSSSAPRWPTRCSHRSSRSLPRRSRRRPATCRCVNDDELLHRYPGTLGGKTGFTDAAKKTFVAAADRGGRRLVIAMMYGLIKEGGPTYWDQAMALFDWGFAQDRQLSVGSL